MNSKLKTFSSIIDYENKWIKVFKNIVSGSDNQKLDFYYVSLNTFVKVIAVNDKNEIALINNFRYILQSYQLELPAGIIEKGEKIENAALRELSEETGIIAQNTKIMGEFFTTNGVSDQKGYGVIASKLSFGETHLDSLEEIEPVKFYSISEIKKLIAKNFIKDGPTLTVLSMYFSQNNL